MVGYQESLLPPHENSATIPVAYCQVRFLQLILDVTECDKTRPMNHVFLFRSAPILSQEPVPTADNFSVKVGSQFWPVIRQTSNAEIATKKRGRKVHIL